MGSERCHSEKWCSSEINHNCEPCLSCQADFGCNKCQKCVDSQTYCDQGGEYPNINFSFSKCVSSGQIIGGTGFTRDTWNEIIDTINSIYQKGEPDGVSRSPLSKDVSSLFINAEKFNEVSKEIGYTTVKSNDLITGALFSGLANRISSVAYDSTQCEECNAMCQIADRCKACDSCQKCNKGQYSGCYQADGTTQEKDPEPPPTPSIK